MKKIIGLVVVTILVFAIIYKQKKTTGTETAASMAPVDPGYCMALRGNGELEPAHWGGLARTVEKLGFPKAMAGGSSATISMFWLNSISMHPLVKNETGVSQKLRASLLIKSLLGFFGETQKTQLWQNFQNFLGKYQQLKAMALTEEALTHLTRKDFKKVIILMKQAQNSEILNTATAEVIVQALEKKEVDRAQFYLSQLKETLSVFGKFDAAHDDNLFFRMPVVSFEKASVQFGKVAAFYSAAEASSSVLKTWTSFFDSCTEGSEGISWPQIIQQKPVCASLIHELFTSYFNSEVKVHLEDQMIGTPIKAFPTTSVLTGNSVREVDQAMMDYQRNLDSHFGQNFKISNPEDVRFGYWGNAQELDSLRLKLNPADEKSRRFLALGPATWREVHSLSPAEPGLSPLKKFTAGGQHYYSAGGWSDLHPLAVLKAYGCENIVYLTRQNGESLFAQGVAKRLLNLDRDWSLLSTSTPEDLERNKKLNDSGDPQADPNGLWSKLYNLANPYSSINSSLNLASVVLCSNWNSFNIKKDLVAAVEDSYRSPLWISPAVAGTSISKLGPSMENRLPGCQP